MESLHLSFQRVVDASMFKGIKLNSSTSLSHMFYADDAMFVSQWCDDNINTLIHVLECFYRVSGLRINMSKSRIMGVLVAENKVKSAATKLGCLLLNTPFTYLGTKVGGSMARSHAWEEVINKVSSRLSKWKMKTLSIGGRLTLLKSVLGSILIFHLSIFKAPLNILRKLESIRSHFFNGHKSSSNKTTWIKWTNVLAPKEKGGLDVKLDNSFRRMPRGGIEHAQFTELSDRVSDVILLSISDRWVWSLEGSGEFTVASIRREIDDKRLSGVNVHAWKVKLDALPTRLNISRRVIVIDS
nr:RNA-directed DNA polymerase, eukaryota, reverse transcriptase zinc-binding domain protein [Tanacetum cinerariifolium]